jgi:hypothetical protein
MVPGAGLSVLSDVGSDQPKLLFLDADVGFVERDVAFAQAFDFASDQHHAAFDLIQDLIPMSRSSIVRNDLTLVSWRCFLVGFLFVFFIGHGNAWWNLIPKFTQLLVEGTQGWLALLKWVWLPACLFGSEAEHQNEPRYLETGDSDRPGSLAEFSNQQDF